ncbi:MAG: hypothetical protein H0V81_12995 [Solirubrobacterales bacterium]|nr:hypothetical protein [Solirubrobacterales bacterium]
MQINSVQNQCKIAFFLDIDGVLNPEDDENAMNAIHRQWRWQVGGHAYDCKNGCVTCKKVKASLFPTSATSAFEALVERVSKVADVHIIISSTWREGYSIDELRDTFGAYRFANQIIGKTSEEDGQLDQWRERCIKQHYHIKEMPNDLQERFLRGELNYTDLMSGGYVKCRASEINEWLGYHPGYSGYLVFDDCDEHLSDNFGEKFICTKHDFALLTEKDCDKAFAVVHQILKEASK